MNTILIRIAMVLLAIVAMFLVYDFSLHIFPWWVALMSAGSLVGVYIGIGWAPIPKERYRLAIGISATAMAIEMVYGTLAGLARLSPEWFEMPLPAWAIIALSVLHGAPFTVLLFFVSMLVLHGNNDNTQIVNDPYIIVRDVAEQQQALTREIQSLAQSVKHLSTPALTDTTDRLTLPDSAPDSYDKAALIEQYGNLTEAAKALGISRQTLYARMNKE